MLPDPIGEGLWPLLRGRRRGHRGCM